MSTDALPNSKNQVHPANGVLTNFQVLDTIRGEIQAEHTLISHRMTWYTTSQSFLMTAYAIAWGNQHKWHEFFQYAIPWLGVLLSILAWLGVWSAVQVQWDAMMTQHRFLTKIMSRFTHTHDNEELVRYYAYAQVTGSKRPTGYWYHQLAMLPPLVIPIVFEVTWTSAYALSIFRSRPQGQDAVSLILLLIISFLFLPVAFYLAVSLWHHIAVFDRGTDGAN